MLNFALSSGVGVGSSDATSKTCQPYIVLTEVYGDKYVSLKGAESGAELNQ